MCDNKLASFFCTRRRSKENPAKKNLITAALWCWITLCGSAYGLPQADILWVFDTSRSMQEDINQVKARIVEFDNAMTSNGIDAHYGLVRFGGSSILIQDIVPFETFNADGSPFRNLRANGGGIERGSQATLVGLQNASFRDNAVINVIVVTDEDDDSSTADYNNATSALENKNALFNFIGVPGVGNTDARYGILASSFGGQAFQIVEFRTDPAPFFSNFIDTKVREIIDALVCDVDADRDVDREDISLIYAARNQPVSGAADPRDPDRNNVINVLDARQCTQLCTLAGCTVISGNEPPVANAGADQRAQLFSAPTVTLDGSGSSDVNSDPLSYAWTIVSTPVGSNVFLAGTDTATPSFVPDLVGIYTFQLIVNDGREDSLPDTVSIEVVNRLVSVPDLTGLTRAEAEAAITAAGLTLGNVTFDNSATVTSGSVISATPQPGAVIADTVPVDLVVSVGPTATAIPDVQNLPQADAEAALVAAGFQIGTVTVINSDSVAAGQVIGTDPPLGNFAEPGSVINLVVSAGPDTTPPQAVITSPAAGEVLLPGSIAISGTASDANLTSWILEYAPSGTEDWNEINSSTVPVVDGVLGEFSTAVLRSNFYRLRLTVSDAVSARSTFIDVSLDNELQLGRFELVFDDLVLPNNQLPVTVRRIYDSSIADSGDFGRGWRLSLTGVDIREDANKNVFVTLPDGRRKAFAFTPQRVSPFFPGSTPQYTAPAGVYDTLEATDECGLVVLSGGRWFCFPGDEYDPAEYRLTTRDGYIFEIGENGGIRRVQDRNGNFIAITDAGITTSAGRDISFNRDAQGRITAIVDPRGNTLQYRYDSEGRLSEFIDQQGDSASFGYLGDSHFLTDLNTPGACQPLRNEYDSSGRVAAKIDANGNRTDYAYDASGLSETITDANGNSYTYRYDSNGNVIETLDPLGNRTLRSYDADNNLSTVVMPSGLAISYTYNSQGLWIEMTEQALTGSALITRRSFNSFSQLTRYELPLGNAVELEYDATGNLLLRKMVDAGGNVLTREAFTYGAGGNPASTTVDGNVETYVHDAGGNLLSSTDATGIGVAYEYDANGNRTAEIDGAGVRTEIAYNGLNLPIRSTTAGKLNFALTYNDQGYVTSVSDAAGAVSRMTYDCINNLLSVEDAAGNITRYDYDKVNSLAGITDARDNRVGYSYDSIPRPTVRTEANGASYGYGYNADGFVNQLTTPNHPLGKTAFERDGNNRIVRAIRPDGEVAMTYDANGNIVRRVAAIAGETIATDLSYDAFSLLRSVTVNGRAIQYDYNARVDIARVTDAESLATDYSYDAAGRISRIDTGADFVEFSYDSAGRRAAARYSNGASMQYSYDGFGRLNRVVMRDAGGNVFADEQHSLDDNGRRTGVSYSDGSASYSYDILGRLDGQTIDSASLGLTTASYSYDAVGNRLDNAAQYSDDNRLLADAALTYSYDLNGNLNGRGAESFTYNADNNLIGYNNVAASASYDYDSLGRRIRRTVNGEVIEYLYDNQNILAEYDAGGNLLARYTYGLVNDEVLMVRRSGQTYFYHQNAHGHVVAITDSSGQVVQRYGYDAWGRLLLNSGIFAFSGPGLVNTRTYTGREYDAESGLYHLRARAYDPSLGRFLQRDPAKGDRFNPQTQNPYVYVINDPLNLADPSGRVAAISYAGILGAPRPDAAFIGFLHGFVTPVYAFLGEFFGLLTPGTPQDAGDLFRQAIELARPKVDDLKELLGAGTRAISNRDTLFFKDSYLNGAGFKVGFKVRFVTIGIGATPGQGCVDSFIPVKPGLRAPLTKNCIEFEGEEIGGFASGTVQGFNLLEGLAPR